MFFSDIETCTACRQHEAKLQRLKTQYAKEKSEGTFRLNWAVIQCHFREKLTLLETSKVLGVDSDAICFEIDIARQNAH